VSENVLVSAPESASASASASGGVIGLESLGELESCFDGAHWTRQMQQWIQATLHVCRFAMEAAYLQLLQLQILHHQLCSTRHVWAMRLCGAEPAKGCDSRGGAESESHAGPAGHPRGEQKCHHSPRLRLMRPVLQR